MCAILCLPFALRFTFFDYPPCSITEQGFLFKRERFVTVHLTFLVHGNEYPYGRKKDSHKESLFIYVGSIMLYER
jgi:hypothetical protein